MVQILSEYYRISPDSLGRISVVQPSNEAGFFHFGPDEICFGQCAAGVSNEIGKSTNYNAYESVRRKKAEIYLPFDPDAVIENLRRERYETSLMTGLERIFNQWILPFYYSLRQEIPAALRRKLQRIYLSGWKNRPFPTWPVDFTVDTLHEKLLRLSMETVECQRIPFIWFWPNGASNCLILTHDVETSAGRDFSSQLIDLDSSYGFRSSFQVVPETRYQVPVSYVKSILDRGCEFNIHDLNHDGLLYRDRNEFLRRAKKINDYCRQFEAKGFRAGSMYRNLDWYGAYEFSYDMSAPNVAHLEPQRGGCCTAFPFFVGDILEVPLTTSEDYSIFHILKDYSIALWKRQVESIRQRNGLISVLAHPDYLMGSPARRVYESLLDYLRRMVSCENIWTALPGEVDQWWRARNQMKLIQKDGNWVIEGHEKQKARIAYAVLDGDRIVYELDSLLAPEDARVSPAFPAS